MRAIYEKDPDRKAIRIICLRFAGTNSRFERNRGLGLAHRLLTLAAVIPATVGAAGLCATVRATCFGAVGRAAGAAGGFVRLLLEGLAKCNQRKNEHQR